MLLGILLLAQLAATIFVPRSFSLSVLNDTIELLLIASAVMVFSVNAITSSSQVRLFWMLLAGSWGVRIVVQAIWIYFELVLRKEAPNPFVGDILLFLCNIPVLAALLLQPNLDRQQRSRSTSQVDFALLLIWWLYLYMFFVIPWQYVVADEARYGRNYNGLAGFLDVVLILAMVFHWAHRSGRRRWFYASFAVSQLLLTWSAYLANRAIDLHVYYPGSWYDLPYSAALASVTVVGLVGYGMQKIAVGDRDRKVPLPITQLGVLAVLSLPVITAWTFANPATPWRVTRFREFVAQGTVFVMASLLFARQRQLRAEIDRSNHILREASLSDPLTGARNRRFFDATISSDTSQVLRAHVSAREYEGRDLIFYMVDLDGFKEVNDRYGHHAGDHVLREVARRIGAVIRSSDILVRWGGDEFLVVSRHTDRDEAAAFASRIMTAVASSEIAILSDNLAVRQTCSIGWAAFPWHPEDPRSVPMEAVLGLADRGVYEAKSAGKNRAVGVLPSNDPSLSVIAPAGERSGRYPVKISSVEGPPKASTVVCEMA